MRLKKSRLVAATAAAGAVCALAAAGAAVAGTTSAWSKSAPAIPDVYTNATPALAAFYQNQVAGTFVAWKGQLDNNVMYRFRVAGKWSPVETIPGAHTDSSPAAAFYTNDQSVPSEFVAWKALHSNTIYYSTGEIGSGATLSWTAPRSIAVKGDTLAYSDSGPAVIFPLNSPGARVIIAWRGPGHHVRYELGSESGEQGRLFSFDKSAWISGGTATTPTVTSTTPALAEYIAPDGNGAVYVFWKAATGKAISYASTPDYLHSGLAGNKTIPWDLLGRVPGADSTSGPTASDLSPHGNAALMLAYKGPSGDHIRYQLFNGTAWSSYAFVTGADSTTAISPALLYRTLASVSPTTSGTIYLHTYNG